MTTVQLVLISIGAALLLAFLGLRAWRASDDANADRVWRDLLRKADAPVDRFDPAMVADLPAPARRFFLYAIASGTPLRTVADITIRGQIGMGDKATPRYLPMQGRQLLAAPQGFVWKVHAGSGAMRMSGSDGSDGARSWVRFWLSGLLPVVRSGGTRDHLRAAFGRVVSEAAFWTPAALLPQHGVQWAAEDERTARATVRYRDMQQTVDITVADDGKPMMIVIPRWSNANPDKTYRLQPFGGYVHDFRDIDGFRLPMRVEGGNFIGSDDYFTFYKAEVIEIRFPAPA